MTAAKRYIKQSTRDYTIVHVEEMQGGPDLDQLLDDLSRLSEDSTSHAGPEADGTWIYEYWGDDAAWRVHVITARSH